MLFYSPCLLYEVFVSRVDSRFGLAVVFSCKNNEIRYRHICQADWGGDVLPDFRGGGRKKMPLPGTDLDQAPSRMSQVPGKVAYLVGGHVVQSPGEAVLVTSTGTDL